MSSTIKVNGLTITGVSGRNIVINDGKVIVDGKDVTPDSKEISIAIEGNVERLQADVCAQVAVSGDVGNISTQSGDVQCTQVGGSVSTMSGDVICSSIAGNASTMSGDVITRG
ncbi:hypothetical protein ACGRSR_17925 [Vibrio owensii]|uniref:hypothetical protein n=1 Tax=Vibrio owensii TaxID=696485 RepID=UPI003748E397